MSKFKLLFAFIGGVVLSLVAIAGTVYGVVASGSIDPGADQEIPSWERMAAKTSLRAYLKTHTPDTKNPLQETDENLNNGCKLYINNCAVCHGLSDAKKTKIAEGFYKHAPLFAAEDWSEDKDGLIYWFIEHGVRLTAMPHYSKSLDENEKWQIVMFIKKMRKLPPSVKATWESVKTCDLIH